MYNTKDWTRLCRNRRQHCDPSTSVLGFRFMYVSVVHTDKESRKDNHTSLSFMHLNIIECAERGSIYSKGNCYINAAVGLQTAGNENTQCRYTRHHTWLCMGAAPVVLHSTPALSAGIFIFCSLQTEHKIHTAELARADCGFPMTSLDNITCTQGQHTGGAWSNTSSFPIRTECNRLQQMKQISCASQINHMLLQQSLMT